MTPCEGIQWSLMDSPHRGKAFRCHDFIKSTVIIDGHKESNIDHIGQWSSSYNSFGLLQNPEWHCDMEIFVAEPRSQQI